MTREEAITEAIRVLGYRGDPDAADHVSVGIFAGLDGVGWYGWNTHYPEDGSLLVGPALIEDIVRAFLSAPEGSAAEDELGTALTAACGSDYAASQACDAYIDKHGPVETWQTT